MEAVRKPQILRAAAEVIVERGLTATRISDVAERAGTSTSAVLYWFESREVLLNEALGDSEERFYRELTGRLAGMDGPAARLRGLIEFSTEDYDWSLWIEVWARALHDPDAAGTRLRFDQRWRDVVADCVSEGQESGEFAADCSPREVALALAAMLDGFGVVLTLSDPELTPGMCCRLLLDQASYLLGAPHLRLDTEMDNRSGPARLVSGG